MVLEESCSAIAGPGCDKGASWIVGYVGCKLFRRAEIGAGMVLPIQSLSTRQGIPADTNGKHNGESEMSTQT